MQLYYKPGACSLATHIVLRELGRTFTLHAVDTQAQRTDSGQDFRLINPKGYVPALDTGTAILTEGAAILQYLAEGSPLLPAVGSLARARVQELLNFTASELHKAFTPFFKNASTEAEREQAQQQLMRHFAYLESLLADGRDYLLGDTFSVADAYLFVVCNWASFIRLSLHDWPALQGFVARIGARPSVQAALQAEGLGAA